MTGPVAPSLDRRQRKSRSALRRALLSLITEKPYGEVTIEDITERADVARATFYAHYRDKSTLLHDASRDLVQEFTARAGSIAARSTVYDGGAVIATFEHAGAHPELYRLVLSGQGGPTIRYELIAAYERTVTSVFSELAALSSSEPRVDISVTITAFVGALVWTLESWLDDQTGLNPAHVAVQFLQGQMGGLEWCLGFDQGETRFDPTSRTTAP